MLMAGADEDQRRPRPGEAADLIKYALWMRLGLRRGDDMASKLLFPMKVDRPSRVLVAGLGAGRKAPRVTRALQRLTSVWGGDFTPRLPARMSRLRGP